MQEASGLSTTPRTISCKAWNSPAEYPSWVARCDVKGSDGIMLNPMFWKKVQGQKHPGRWGIVEQQIPSIKVVFKTNAKSHKHLGIKLLSSESKTQLVNQRKQISYRRTYIYIYINTELLDGNKCHQRKHIIQTTGFGARSSTCCHWDGEDVPAPWERSNSHHPVPVQKSCDVSINQSIVDFQGNTSADSNCEVPF